MASNYGPRSLNPALRASAEPLSLESRTRTASRGSASSGVASTPSRVSGTLPIRIPVVSLTSDKGKLNVVVSNIEQDGILHLQNLKWAQGFNNLMVKLNMEMKKRTDNTKNEKNGTSWLPDKGLYCVAKSIVDGCWYRAVVLEVLETGTNIGIIVKYIDFGNDEILSASDVYPMTPYFFKFPAQAISVRLHGSQTALPEGVADSMLLELTDQIINNHFKCQVVNKRDMENRVFVELFTVQNGKASQNLMDILIERYRPGSSRPGGRSSSHSLVTPSSSQLSNRVASELPFKRMRLEDGKKYDVLLVYCLSPGAFWCQLEQERDRLEQLMDYLQRLYRSNRLRPLGCWPPDARQAIAAQFTHDNAWYRGVVLGFADNKAEVLFVDYGNTELLGEERCAELPHDLLNMEAFAFPCSLDKIEPIFEDDWGSEATLVLDTLSQQKGLSAIVVGTNSANHLKVDLIDTNSPSRERNIARELVLSKMVKGSFDDALQDGPQIARPAKSNSSPEIVEPLAEVPTDASFPPAKDVSGQTAEVSLAWAVNPGEFYLHLTDQNEELERIEDRLANEYADLGPRDRLLPSASAGTVCVARFTEDDAYYRACVIEVLNEKCLDPLDLKTSIRFVDFGNGDVVPRSQLKSLHPALLEQPPMALRCHLKGIRPSGLNEDWNSAATTFMDRLCENEKVTCIFGKKGEAADYEVELCVNGKNVAWELCNAGYGFEDKPKNAGALAAPVPTPVPAPAERVAISTEEPSTFPALKESSPLDVNHNPSLVIPFLRPFEGLKKGFVTFYNSPDSFYLQLCEMENEMFYLTRDLKNFYSQSTGRISKVQGGGYVCAKWNKDGSWYRAIVESEDEDYVRAFFLDYGNSDKIHKDDVRPLAPQFFGRAQAYHCRLFKPDGAMWTLGNDTSSLFEYCEFQVTFKDPSCLTTPFTVSLYRKGEDLSSLLSSTPENKSTPIKEGLSSSKLNAEAQIFSPSRSRESKHVIALDDESSVAGSQSVEILTPALVLESQSSAAKSQSSSLKFHLVPLDSRPPESRLISDVPPPKKLNQYPDGPDLTGTSTIVELVWPESPLEFYVQLKSRQEELQELGQRIGSLYSSFGPDDHKFASARVRSLCVAKYAVDGGWYRAEVLEPPADMNWERLLVQFVDYGNSAEVDKADLKRVHPSFRGVVPGVVRCTLKGIRPLSGQDNWDKRVVGEMERICSDNSLECRFVSWSDSPGFRGTYLVEIDVGGKDLVTEICKSGLGVSVDNDKRNEPALVSAGVAVNPPKSASPHMESFSESPPVSVPCHPIPQDPRPSLITHFNSIDSFFIQLNDMEDVVVNLTNNIFELYSSCGDAYKLSRTCPGAFVCAKWSDDGWYRSLVKSVDGDRCHVLFVDYGNDDDVAVTDIRRLDERWALTPALAYHCCLGKPDSTSWLPEVDRAAKRMLLEKVVTVQFSGGEDANKVESPVTVALALDGKDVATLLVRPASPVDDLPPPDPARISPQAPPNAAHINESSIIDSASNSLTAGKTSLSSSKDYAYGKSSTPAKGTCDEIISGPTPSMLPPTLPVVDIEPPCGFSDSYPSRGSSRRGSVSSRPGSPERMSRQPERPRTPLHLKSSAKTGSMIELVMHVNAISQANAAAAAAVARPLFTASPIPKQRSRVLIMHQEGIEKVWFQLVENDSVGLKLMEKLNSVYSDCESGTGPAVLTNPKSEDCCIAKSSSDSCWYRAIVEGVLVEIGAVQVRYVDFGNKDTIPLSHLRIVLPELTTEPCLVFGPLSVFTPGTKPALNCDLKFKAILEQERPFDIEVTEDGRGVRLFTVPEGKEVALEEGLVESRLEECKQRKAYTVQYLTVNTEFVCYYSAGPSPNTFYVQASGCENDLNQIMKTISQAVSQFPKLLNVEEGFPCVAKFSEDNNWYRAEVLRCLPNGLIRVRFVDYGNSEDVPNDFTRLRDIPESILKPPVNSTLCRAAGLRSKEDVGWSEEAKKDFSNLINNVELHLFVENSTPVTRRSTAHPFMYDVYIGDCKGSINMSQKFLDKGHAIKDPNTKLA